MHHPAASVEPSVPQPPTHISAVPHHSASRPRRLPGGAWAAACLCALMLLAGRPSPALAVCPESNVLETMLTKICWGCVFPFRLGGKTLISRGFLSDPASPRSTFCQCSDTLLLGVTVQFTEPARLIRS